MSAGTCARLFARISTAIRRTEWTYRYKFEYKSFGMNLSFRIQLDDFVEQSRRFVGGDGDAFEWQFGIAKSQTRR